MTDKISYCESVYATGTSPWHLRRLTAAGRKLGGGVDTASLCGRVQPPYGWDLESKVDLLKGSVCLACVAALCAAEREAQDAELRRLYGVPYEALGLEPKDEP